jgi:methylated-DNA-[protein]-cysteine S-methyltransferase
MGLAYKMINTPVARLKLVAGDEGLVAILWQNERLNRVRLEEATEDPSHPTLVETEQQLGQYFAGERHIFSLPLDMRGTSFQKSVWHALLAIPFGETRSYGQLAKQLGNANAMRAVGAANGRNPISIVVPCHRVIGASGDLTGFGGGLEIKAQLLHLEQRGSRLFT